MKLIEKITEKRIYINPEIVCVELDNEISLALQSLPPEGPGEGQGRNEIHKPDCLGNEPFKTYLG